MGSEERAQEFVDAGEEGVPDRREAARTRRAAVRRRPHRLGRRPGRVVQGPGREQKKIAETFRQAARRRGGSRRTARRRGRDLLGRHALVAADGAVAGDGRPARDRRLPGRHGAHAALHDGLQRAGGPHPAGELRLEGPGRARRSAKKLTDALRPWTIDFHVAQNNATVHGSGSHDKTGRHCLAERSQRQARHRASTPATGCATRTASRRKAFQHICWDGCMFPTVVMEAADVERHPGRDGEGARRARVGLDPRRPRSAGPQLG